MKYLTILFPVFSERYNDATFVNKVIKILESILSLIFIIYITAYATIGSYSNKVKYCDNEYFTLETTTIDCESINAYLIENSLIYKFLALTLDEQELGFTGLTGSVFLNHSSITSNQVNIEEVYIHELEHVNQKALLGFIKYHKTPSWVLEGGAEYFRGQPTIPICEDININSFSTKQIYYKQSWILAYYHLELQKLDYLDFLQLQQSDIKDTSDIEQEVVLNFCN